MTDKYFSMYKLKHATKMLVIHLAMEENLASHLQDYEEIWEYRVKDTVSNIDDEIDEVIEAYLYLNDKKQELMDKFIK